MTNADYPDRLDRIERDLETLTQNTSQLERVSGRHDRQIEANSQAIQQLIQLSIRLAERQEQDAQRFSETEALAQRNTENLSQLLQLQRQLFERSESEMASIRAALERIDRVMDYLMRRDGGQA